MVASYLLANKRRLLGLIVFITFSILVGGLFYVRFEIIHTHADVKDNLSSIAKLKESQVSDWFHEREADVESYSKSPFLIDNYAKLIKNPTSEQQINSFRTRLELIKVNFDYHNVLLASADGRVLISAEEDSDHLDSSSHDFVRAALQEGVVQFSGFYFYQPHHELLLDFIAPIISNDGRDSAAIIFRVDPNTFLFPFIQSWPGMSRTAETLLVRADGDSVRFLNELRHRKNTSLKLAFPLNQLSLPATQAVLGYEGILVGRDYRDIKVVSDIRRVDETPWYLITKIDAKEAYQNLRYRAILITLFILLLALFASAILLWLYHYQQRNLFKKLYDSEKQLSEANEMFKTTLYSIGDAVITTDQQGLIIQMNPVAEKLTGWSEKDANGKHLTTVFKIINEESRKTVQDPVKIVLSEGAVVGLANHTLLISKSGIETPIADSGAPIKDSNGKIIGVVLVFRDQTKEQEAIKNLEASRKQFKRLFDSTNDGIALHEIIYNEDQVAVDYRIIEVNPQFESILGISRDQAIGKTATELYGVPADLDVYIKVAESRESEIFDTFFPPLDKHFHISVFSPAEGQFATAFKDITDRVKSEQALKNIEWMLSPHKDEFNNEVHQPEYGDLTSLNKDGVINHTVGEKLLSEIGGDFMHLLGTSTAIYEKDGHYALGLFSSSWCQFLDQTSRKLVDTDDNQVALESGRWLCHESCWRDASKIAIETGKTADIQCQGGIHLYTLPIFANQEVVGAINFGYGNPPDDFETLQRISNDYRVDIEDLKQQAQKYEARPPFIIELAKERLASSAKLIGALVERKLMNDRLEESEHRFRILFDKAPLGYQSLDFDGRFIDVNDAWLSTLGYTSEEVLGKYFIDFLAEDHRKPFKKRYEYFKQQGFIQSEFEMIHKSGNKIRVTFNGRIGYDPDGKFRQTHCILQDVTEQRKIEEQLISEQQKLQTILETIPDQVYYKDHKGRFILCNTPVAKNLGLDSPDQLIGKTDFDLFPKEFAQQYWEDEQQIILTGKPMINHEEPLYVTETGDVKWNLTSKVPITDQKGKIIGLIGVNRDITDRQHMIRELVEAKNKAEEVGRLKSRLISNLSHEIRTPLNGILGFAELLRDEIEEPATNRMADIIFSSGNRLLNTLNGILDLSVIEADSDQVKSAKLDLNKIAGECASLFKATAEKKGLKIYFEADNGTVTGLGDEELVTKILNNLINNAIKFTPEGEVTIHTRTHKRDGKNYSLIQVKDTGIGVRKEEMKLIFDEFRQVSEGHSKSYDGAGLGLYISRRFAEMMGGEIEVESEIGKGSTFSLVLPGE